MQGKTHVLLAVTAALVIPEQPPDALSWGAVLIGSLFPDIDAGGGKIAYLSNFLPKSTPRAVARTFDAVGVGASTAVRHAVGHRGVCHWAVWGLLAMAGARWGNLPEWAFWFGFGFLMHVLGDALTVSGVPLLAPLYRGDISLLPMRTGSTEEKIIYLALGVCAVWFGARHLGYDDELRGVIEQWW